jgi:hypothetical protein
LVVVAPGTIPRELFPREIFVLEDRSKAFSEQFSLLVLVLQHKRVGSSLSITILKQNYVLHVVSAAVFA